MQYPRINILYYHAKTASNVLVIFSMKLLHKKSVCCLQVTFIVSVSALKCPNNSQRCVAIDVNIKANNNENWMEEL